MFAELSAETELPWERQRRIRIEPSVEPEPRSGRPSPPRQGQQGAHGLRSRMESLAPPEPAPWIWSESHRDSTLQPQFEQFAELARLRAYWRLPTTVTSAELRNLSVY